MTQWFSGFEARHVDVGDQRLFVRTGGRADGPAVLLLHGFPQTHAMWHRVAQRLAERFFLVMPDLPGYGRSGKPPTTVDHGAHSKKAMAGAVSGLMRVLGRERFAVVGHDRGGRVAHRLALDAPDAIERLCVIDIVPTVDMYDATDMQAATLYYHWFHLIQPEPLPERMIGHDARFYLHWKLGGWGAGGTSHIEPEALADYEQCFDEATIHAMCEDYRAGASVDLADDRASRAAGLKIRCPLHVLWGARGVVHRLFEPLDVWRAQCTGPVAGRALPAGHYVAEELPGEIAQDLLEFLA